MTETSKSNPPERQTPAILKGSQRQAIHLTTKQITILVAILALIGSIYAANTAFFSNIAAAYIGYRSNMDSRKLDIENTQQANTAIAKALISAPAVRTTIDAAPTILAVTTSPEASSDLTCTQAVCRYQFGQDSSGWDVTDVGNLRQAFRGLSTTSMVGPKGTTSSVLQLTVDFTGGINVRARAVEIQVDLAAFPPAGQTGKVSFENKVITAWMWAPQGTIGSVANPNGIQLFVKDSNGANCYAWTAIPVEEKWFRSVWQKPDATACDATFDSAQPVKLGIQVALNPNSVITNDKTWTFFFDDIGWTAEPE
jgi:hypothetical protein